jgi:hypothetical protein
MSDQVKPVFTAALLSRMISLRFGTVENYGFSVTQLFQADPDMINRPVSHALKTNVELPEDVKLTDISNENDSHPV